jgi:hypothetical protein
METIGATLSTTPAIAGADVDDPHTQPVSTWDLR